MQVWVRLDSEAGKRERSPESAFEDKESYKWVEGLPAVGPAPTGPQLVTVCDREAHVYEFLDAVLARGMDFIVRATQGRSLTVAGASVFTALAGQPAQASATLMLKPAFEIQYSARFTDAV